MNRKVTILILGLVFCVAGLKPAEAKSKAFSTSYIKFNLDDSWNCKQIKEIFACAPRQGPALVVIAAKIPGKHDNLKAYQKYLKMPVKRVNVNGKAFKSHPKLVKIKDINGVKWVDAIHLSSEVPNYLTRYLATVYNGVAMLVTYTIAKEAQLKFAPALLKMAKAIKVIAQPPRSKVKGLKADKSNLKDPGAPEKTRATASTGH